MIKALDERLTTAEEGLKELGTKVKDNEEGIADNADDIESNEDEINANLELIDENKEKIADLVPEGLEDLKMKVDQNVENIEL